MEKMSLKELAVPLIKSIDSFNYLLKSHHRRTAVIAYYIGSKMKLSHDELVDLVVAASLHDIGAMSIQERDLLIKEDVEHPEPHCIMGWRMLSSFEIFHTVSKIIKHHHIKYSELEEVDDEVLIQSHIIHLADRVDILIPTDKFILNEKKEVTVKILDKCGDIFHPEVCKAFEAAAKADIFWIDINNMSIEQLFDSIKFDYLHELTLDQTMQFALMVSRIIDFRSKFTASHSFSVGHLAKYIGSKLGLDIETCSKLLIAGYFHDIGKIGIDTEYIEKKGKLSEEEFNHVKLHCYYTGQILKELNKSDWFKDIVNWAEHHHEKIDGSGYPYAIGQGEFDLGVKILAYSDIISALMEDRPYREGLSADSAFDIVEKNIAEKIDPEMFNKIAEHKDMMKEIVDWCKHECRKVYNKEEE